MVETIAQSGVRDARVLAAIEAVPRHLLVPQGLTAEAYRPSSALPIGEGQTISAPDVVAFMSQALSLAGTERVLEVGTGSGYQAAVLSRLAEQVISVECRPKLAARARQRLDALGITNVVVHFGDGSLGRPQDAPFDAILVTAGGPQVPTSLLAQLAPHGRLVGPFGTREAQSIHRYRRNAEGELKSEVLARCRFVDLVGANGWGTA